MLNIEELKEIISSFGADYYDSELVSENNHKIFRVYITSKDGVTLDKCAKISEVISPILDLNPPVNDNYFLEVSSPGIERKLKTNDHFASSIGELVKITLFTKEKIDGRVVDVRDNIIKIETNNENITINFENIQKAKTYFDW